MKNFYYFSKHRLKFVEIPNFQKKFIFLTVFFSIIVSFFIFGGYILIKELINPDAKVKSLQAENRELENKFTSLVSKFGEIEGQLDSLSILNNELRLAVNLEPVTEEERKLGTGGSIFGELKPVNSAAISDLLKVLDSFSEKVSMKVKFEKSNYYEIKNTLNLNEKLYDALPAIRPAKGRFGDRFGMRRHPILKITRMHNGIDIVSDVGTPVYAPGAGVVEYVGRKGGYGKTLEINHGFGYRTLYAHLSKVKVKRGQKLKRGTLIAYSGNTGKLSTGPHLHYEIRHNGIALNPRNFIYEDIELFDLFAIN